MSDETYKVIRYFQNDEVGPKIVATGLTLEEAQAHCQDPESTSSKCKSQEGCERTKRFGNWFDGYREE